MKKMKTLFIKKISNLNIKNKSNIDSHIYKTNTNDNKRIKIMRKYKTKGILNNEDKEPIKSKIHYNLLNEIISKNHNGSIKVSKVLYENKTKAKSSNRKVINDAYKLFSHHKAPNKENAVIKTKKEMRKNSSLILNNNLIDISLNKERKINTLSSNTNNTINRDNSYIINTINGNHNKLITQDLTLKKS